jgi:hypothetical protein
MDSVCNYQETRDQGLRLCALHGFDYWYIECQVEDIDLLDKRRARESL